ncbi:zinc finger protein 883-like [Penaeus monodon]|uniref:zinc finger protein 883-like n=1 Tax=Penaeus monodon TaxID=6687 RepID=UPI0018A72646|nr:zinc finger protein 883-like [Penaeus monodon]
MVNVAFSAFISLFPNSQCDNECLADWIPLAPLKDEEIYARESLFKEELHEDDSTDVDDICYKKVHPINFNDKSYRYQICNKTFTCGNLRRHMTAHTKKPYSCEICNKAFSTNSGRVRHMGVHTKYICNKKFSHKGYIGGHKEVHANEKP